MYKERPSWVRTIAAAALCALLAGCSGAHPHLGGASAPALDDAPLSRSGGTNPNAPFAMLAPAHALARRPVLMDPTLAEPCTAAQLGAYESGASVAGEQRAVRISLVNHGAEPCRLSGVPAVSLVAADGSPLAQVVVERAGVASTAGDTPEPAPVAVLPARGESEFSVRWTAGPNCPAVASIAVSAPGTTHSYLVPHPLTVCGDRIVVSQVSGPEPF
jgi:hypothetical protein